MNQDELIEKCRLADDEIEIASAVGRERYCKTHYLSKLPRFNGADKARTGEKEVAEAQLRKAIPIIEAEARKAEREKSVQTQIKFCDKLLEVGMEQERKSWVNTWFVVKAVIMQHRQALKGEGDV